MKLGRYLLAFGAALVVSIGLQLLLTVPIVLLVMSGIASNLQSLSLYLFGSNVLSDILAYTLESFVAFGGVLAAGNIAPATYRGVSCFIITFLCLVISELPLISMKHRYPDHGWLYLIFTDPLLYFFALGGICCSIYFVQRDRKESKQI